MKIRLILRNDGKFQYEYAYEDELLKQVFWNRIDHLLFSTERNARESLTLILEFRKAAETKEVIQEIEI